MTGPSEHVDLDELADYQAGLTSAERSAEIATHLETCASCAAALESLTAVVEALGRAPKVTMPTDVAERLQATIDEEAAAHSDAASRTIVPLGAKRQLLTRVNVAAAAAVAAVIALVAVVSLGHTDKNSSNVTAATAPLPTLSVNALTPIQSEALKTSVHVTGDNYTAMSLDPKLGAQIAAAAVPGSAGGQAQPGPELPASRGSSTPNSSTPATTKSSKAPQIVESGLAVAAPPQLAPFSNPTRLADCINDLTAGKPILPLLVNLARYEGKPAVIVVFPANPVLKLSTPAAYVVDPSCGSSTYSQRIDAFTTITVAPPSPAPPVSPTTSAPK